MIRTIVVDDEQLNIDLILLISGKYCPEIEVVATACSIDEGLEKIIRDQPDLLILDIEIGEKTAFDLLKVLNNNKLHVILITAYDHYGIQGIKYGVLDYLLKPIQASDFVQAITRVKDRILSLGKYEIPTNPVPDPPTFISVASKEDVALLKREEIMHLEAKGNYTEITTRDLKKFTSSKLLKEYENLMADTSFIRVHNSHIININYVTKYIRTKTGSVQLLNHVIIPIAASKKKEVQELLGLKS